MWPINIAGSDPSRIYDNFMICSRTSLLPREKKTESGRRNLIKNPLAPRREAAEFLCLFAEGFDGLFRGDSGPLPTDIDHRPSLQKSLIRKLGRSPSIEMLRSTSRRLSDIKFGSTTGNLILFSIVSKRPSGSNMELTS